MLRSRFVLLLGASLALTTPVLAQPVSDSDRALAAGHDALDLYNKGSWSEARAKFEEAEKLAHSPVFLLYAARCARNAGDLVTARALYERVTAESVPQGAPAPWPEAVKSANEELTALKKRMAEGAPTASASVPVPTASVSVPVPTASASVPVPTASVSVPVPTTSMTVVDPWGVTPRHGNAGNEGSSDGSLVPGLVTLGVGIAALGTGIGLFAHAKSTADGILTRCGEGPCLPEDEPKKNTAYDFARASTAAFVGGGVLGAAGVALLLWRPFGRTSPQKQGVTVAPGLGMIRVTGSF